MIARFYESRPTSRSVALELDWLVHLPRSQLCAYLEILESPPSAPSRFLKRITVLETNGNELPLIREFNIKSAKTVHPTTPHKLCPR